MDIILGYQTQPTRTLDAVILMREKGFKFLAQLDNFIKKSVNKR